MIQCAEMAVPAAHGRETGRGVVWAQLLLVSEPHGQEPASVFGPAAEIAVSADAGGWH